MVKYSPMVYLSLYPVYFPFSIFHSKVMPPLFNINMAGLHLRITCNLETHTHTHTAYVKACTPPGGVCPSEVLFKSYLMLETDKLYFEPSCNEFQSTLKVILSACCPQPPPWPILLFLHQVRKGTQDWEEQSVRKKQINMELKLMISWYIPMQECIRTGD